MVSHSYSLSKDTDLSHSDIGLLGQCSTSLSLQESNHTHCLNYDDRIQLFQMLSNSALFSQDTIQLADLAFWFPEFNYTDFSPFLVLKEDVSESLECVLAILMEGDRTLFDS